MRRGAKPTKPKVEAELAVLRKSLKNEASRRRQLEKRLAESLEREKATGELLQEQSRALTEAFDRQTATSEILRVIASSPTDLQPILNVVAERAARLCDADDVSISRTDDDSLRFAAGVGIAATAGDKLGPDFRFPLDRGSVAGRAVLDRATLHIHDLAAESEDEYPTGKALQRRFGIRTILSTPLLRGGTPLGVINVLRTELRPFTDKQIELLQTFAAQAVIAIENVRLFKELETRNRALTEALEQQTATSEILRVISSSPTHLQPVLDAVAESAARLCDATDANVLRTDNGVLRFVAWFGSEQFPPVRQLPISRASPGGRAVVDRQTIHVHDMAADVETEYSESKVLRQLTGTRTILCTPLLREGNPIGVIVIRRLEVRPFTDKQIALLQTFADQAVIAIENARLFQELQARNRELIEALDQQTATSEILRVISSSPTDLQPVMDAIAESAARLCEAVDTHIYRADGDIMRLMASLGSVPTAAEVPIRRGTVNGRALLDRRTVHVHDLAEQVDTEFPDARDYQERYGTRTILATPLVREGFPLGVVLIRRTEVRPFTDKQIALLQTFADQAVIAIENVRLFQELQARTRELGRSVEELRALGEVSRAVSSTLDLETVLTTIVARAVQLSAASGGGVVYEYDEVTEQFRLRATHGMDAALSEALQAAPIRLGEGAMGQAGLTRAPVQVADIVDERAVVLARVRPVLMQSGYRSLLAVPLLLEQRIMGGLVVWRRESGPFDPAVVNLLQAFATQSVLAIQNARLFRELDTKGRQLEAASRHKSEFLANMSHELRTPLNAIIGFSEVLSERMFGEVNDKQAEYLQDILASGRHLLSLINDILDLSKVEAGRLELELASFNLPVAVENALTLVRERATRHGITLDEAVDERVGDIVADERKVKQILLNLLSNAVKFTPAGGRVGVTATAADGVITISVSDTGTGIAPEDQAAIFEEFRQVGRDDARKQEGTGLGLTLAKKFVELHGGQIWVRSQVGQGSTFTFTLPVRPEGTSSTA